MREQLQFLNILVYMIDYGYNAEFCRNQTIKFIEYRYLKGAIYLSSFRGMQKHPYVFKVERTTL